LCVRNKRLNQFEEFAAAIPGLVCVCAGRFRQKQSRKAGLSLRVRERRQTALKIAMVTANCWYVEQAGDAWNMKAVGTNTAERNQSDAHDGAGTILPLLQGAALALIASAMCRDTPFTQRRCVVTTRPMASPRPQQRGKELWMENPNTGKSTNVRPGNWERPGEDQGARQPLPKDIGPPGYQCDRQIRSVTDDSLCLRDRRAGIQRDDEIMFPGACFIWAINY